MTYPNSAAAWYEDLRRLAEAQNHRCAYCGVEMLLPPLDYIPGALESQAARSASEQSRCQATRMRRATREHVVPRVYNGSDKPDNLVAVCAFDNAFRGRLPLLMFWPTIQSIVKAGMHPHQIYERTGKWTRARTLIRQLGPLPTSPASQP